MEWEIGNCEKVKIKICYSGDDNNNIKVSQLPCTNRKTENRWRGGRKGRKDNALTFCLLSFPSRGVSILTFILSVKLSLLLRLIMQGMNTDSELRIERYNVQRTPRVCENGTR